jgi:hypothetical protein
MKILVLLFHHECNNPVCKMVSFTYGAGFPALWRHQQITVETHEWIRQEFKSVPLCFFRQISKCVSKGHLVSVEGDERLPKDFVAEEPKTDARFAFFAGKMNRCFLYESQVKSYEYFSKLRPDYHTLHLLAGYSHLDVFMGSRAAEEVFPLMVAELENSGD